MDSTTIAISSSSYFSKSTNPKPNPRLSRLNFTFFKTLKFIQTPNYDFNYPSSSPSPLKPKSRNAGSSFPCWAVTSSPTPTTDEAACKLQRLISEFQSLSEPVDRVKRLLHYASLIPPFDESLRVTHNRVMGCTAQVWLDARMGSDGKMRFAADSDSEITKGFCSCLVWVLDGAAPEEVLSLKADDFAALNAGLHGRSNSRVNTWHNVLISMQKRTKALVAEREGKPPGELFPSLVITTDGIHAKGSYAEAQARFLSPDELKVQELANVLRKKKIDSAVKMAKAGCQFITVLGVDFMSENVRAILDQAGFAEVGVYRMSNERIGCSLADAAANPAYMDYLGAASMSSPSLHVVYINTSLETKAHAHELVPTITCTSSNVVQTILQVAVLFPSINSSHMMTVMTDKKLLRFIRNTTGTQLDLCYLACTIIRMEHALYITYLDMKLWRR
ncbi:hypothetical protein F0562_024327 [Nyssa sinensis]|uniref:Fe-S metabolism associated domain-containing protein n=1 Tax=Nyssa sinensis TaxID=561372 RepID=A0A5J5BDL9_9ASTE|nr:hypothetical protein F0562_024327 [Nyssa sinensis]